MSTIRASRSMSWRVVDIVVASILGVACGLLFLIWNSVGYAWFLAMDALTPGLGGLASGVWFIGGIIGGLIIRKPGAALYVEMLAASVSAALGSQWGIENLYSGFAQGIGAELILAVFVYRKFSLSIAVLAGAFAGLGAWTLELFTSANIAKSFEFNAIYLACTTLSGAILAGALGWMLVRALAKTGALDRFAAGREVRTAPGGVESAPVVQAS